MTSKFAEMESLTRMILDAELAELRTRSGEVAKIAAKRAALAHDRAARADALRREVPDDDIAFASGQDARWNTWLNRESQRLGTEIAQAAARQEAQRLRAKQAFGRVEALTRLKEHELAERKIQAMRRSTDQSSAG